MTARRNRSSARCPAAGWSSSPPSTAPPRPHPPPDDVQRIRYTRNAAGQTLAYAVTGSGPPLLRFNFIGSDLEAEWHTASQRGRFDTLAATNTLIRFDFAGTGRSERTGISTDFDTLAKDALAVADAAGIDRFAIYAESAGVFPALHFAARWPDRVTHLVTLGGYVEGRARRMGTGPTEPMRDMALEAWDTKDSPIANALHHAYLPEASIETVRETTRLLQTGTDAESEKRLRDAVNASSLEHLLPNVACPTLVVHSRNDAIHPLTEAQRLTAGIPDAQLVILETANHLPLPDQPAWDSFIETLRAFLAE